MATGTQVLSLPLRDDGPELGTSLKLLTVHNKRGISAARTWVFPANSRDCGT